MKRIAIFASGNGTNLENILKHVRRRRIRAEVAFCFSDNPKAGALRRARRLGFSTIMFTPGHFPSKKLYEHELTRHIKREKVDYIILAGYMRVLGKEFIRVSRNRILNIHPAILPSFKGTHAIKDAYDYGVKVTGVTVHFADDSVDGGPVISQEAVPIQSGESLPSLEKRIHQVEYRLYPKAINLLLNGKLKIKGRRVIHK
ncbi:MAG: phosphoribosylglycinamide formyltransferase [Candidatus Omnitrophica bacterium]|nr:phosphoribosylglycinamide formyltransferase [Candidatus Omnitrophota bacterium]